MNSKETVLAQATRTRSCGSLGYGKNAQIKITAKAYQLGGNRHPHFSVTAVISVPGRHDCEACGCLHDEAVKFWPAIKPIVDLHLSNADDGEPMHGEANGWYNMAGALGGAGERYHRGNSEMHFPCAPPEGKSWPTTEYRKPTADDCLKLCADHLRVSVGECEGLRARLLEVAKAEADVNFSPDWALVRAEFGKFVDAQRPRWMAEAEAGLALIRSLAGESAAVAV